MSKTNLAAIEDLKRRLKPAFEKFPAVKFAYLFGSVAEGEAGPLSDIDIAVYLDPLTSKTFYPCFTPCAFPSRGTTWTFWS